MKEYDCIHVSIRSLVRHIQFIYLGKYPFKINRKFYFFDWVRQAELKRFSAARVHKHKKIQIVNRFTDYHVGEQHFAWSPELEKPVAFTRWPRLTYAYTVLGVRVHVRCTYSIVKTGYFTSPLTSCKLTSWSVRLSYTPVVSFVSYISCTSMATGSVRYAAYSRTTVAPPPAHLFKKYWSISPLPFSYEIVVMLLRACTFVTDNERVYITFYLTTVKYLC